MISATMCLGLFVFGLNTIPYQTRQHEINWRHVGNSRVGARNSNQFIGPGDELLTLSGYLVPEITGSELTLDLVRAMADTGKSWLLISGLGEIVGAFVIEKITRTASSINANGSAKKIEFTINLRRVDSDDIDRLGSLVGLARAGVGMVGALAKQLK